MNRRRREMKGEYTLAVSGEWRKGKDVGVEGGVGSKERVGKKSRGGICYVAGARGEGGR
jgi:hypothetical protein